MQRAVIVLRAKKVEFKVTYIDLTNKPDWFLKISPHGKVPVLLVGERPLFESNAIAEYLEETVTPHLHPKDPIERARNRAWTDYIADFSEALGKVYYAKSDEELRSAVTEVRPALDKLEKALESERHNAGPFFNGPTLSLVDAAYAPFFQRFRLCESVLATGLLDDYPKVAAWAEALANHEAVTGSVDDTFESRFVSNLVNRGMIAGPKLSAA